MDGSALGYRLVPLSCPACGAPLAAEGDDVVYYCTACRNGHVLERTSGALRPVAVTFLAVPGKAVTRRLPFWLLPARLEMLERATAGGGNAFLRLFGGGDQAPAASSDVVFAVPAFAAPLGRAVELAKRYSAHLSQQGVGTDELLAEGLTGGSLRIEDAKRWAEFAMVAAELDKPDLLTQLRYRLTFGDARLLGVPFVGTPGALRDALFGLPVA